MDERTKVEVEKIREKVINGSVCSLEDKSYLKGVIANLESELKILYDNGHNEVDPEVNELNSKILDINFMIETIDYSLEENKMNEDLENEDSEFYDKDGTVEIDDSNPDFTIAEYIPQKDETNEYSEENNFLEEYNQEEYATENNELEGYASEEYSTESSISEENYSEENSQDLEEYDLGNYSEENGILGEYNSDEYTTENDELGRYDSEEYTDENNNLEEYYQEENSTEVEEIQEDYLQEYNEDIKLEDNKPETDIANPYEDIAKRIIVARKNKIKDVYAAVKEGIDVKRVTIGEITTSFQIELNKQNEYTNQIYNNDNERVE